MESKAKFFAALIILIIAVGLSYYYFMEKPEQDAADSVAPGEKNSTVEIANPASVSCRENNGTLVLRTDSGGGQYGVCIFSSGAECEEWAYYRGECVEKKDAVLGKEFSLWVGSLAQLKLINMELLVLNLSEDTNAVSIKASHNGKESELTINKDAEASFEGYSIKLVSIAPTEGAAGNKPNDYKIRFNVSKIEKPADNSCNTDSDCTIKDVGNLCGKYLDCVNKNYTPVPPEINSNICGYPPIDGCKCIERRCVGTIAGNLDIN